MLDTVLGAVHMFSYWLLTLPFWGMKEKFFFVSIL